MMPIKLQSLLTEIFNESDNDDDGEIAPFSASRSKRTAKFKELCGKLPASVQTKMIEKFQQWATTGVLRLHTVQKDPSYRSMRISSQYRAIAKIDQGHLIWVWAGTHNDYNREVARVTTRYANVRLLPPKPKNTINEDEFSLDIQDLFNPDGSINL